MGEYAGYVVAAYAITAATVVGLILWVLVSRRSARKELARAERVMARRQSGQGAA